MESRKLWASVIAVAIAALATIWFFLGPTGTETVEAIDQTAEQVTGKSAVDHGEALRREVEAISEEHRERLRQLELDPGATESR